MPIIHAVLRFDPSGSPIAANDAGTLHITIPKGKFGFNNIWLKDIKASARVLQSEIPAVMPILGLFLSKGSIATTTAQSFPLWNNAADFYYPDIFYHHIFSALPENAEPHYYSDYAIENSDAFMASLVIDNTNQAATFATVVRIHLMINYELWGL